MGKMICSMCGKVVEIYTIRYGYIYCQECLESYKESLSIMSTILVVKFILLLAVAIAIMIKMSR